MKKLSILLLSGVVLALAGCGNQGGSSDQYDTDSGTTTSPTTTSPNYNRQSVTNDYQSTDSLRPERNNSTDIYSTNNATWDSTNTNTNSQPLDRERTNTLPEN